MDRSHDKSRRRGAIRRPGPWRVLAALLALGQLPASPALSAAAPEITVVSTTSTENSGLMDELLPLFTADTGIRVRLISVGTGQALRIGRNGDADALLVHHPASEIGFVEAGFGTGRTPVMVNDFVLVGPADDPAGVRGMTDAAEALARIAARGGVFVSRGDDSGTHHKERELWAAGAVDPTTGHGTWYRETGSGQGATLNVASAQSAYALTDRATWLYFGNKGELAILVEGDARLDNPYSAIAVNPARHPHVAAAGARAFVDWLVSERGQGVIAGYRIDGQPAFHPACPGGACAPVAATAAPP
jgi:tungstate transport system substrate-binding protein